jgi:hypothetical protein
LQLKYTFVSLKFAPKRFMVRVNRVNSECGGGF